MARFRKARRRGSVMKRSRRGQAAFGGIKPFEVAIGSAGYGFIRPHVASILPDIPMLQGYSDNVIMGGLAALAAWKGKGLIKKAGIVILANESFIASARLTQGMGQVSASSVDSYNA
jgi:hypothetical protein